MYNVIDSLFEQNRTTAYQKVLAVTVSKPGEASMMMSKAYLTYVSNDNLEGYEGGGQGWLKHYLGLLKNFLAEQ